MVLILCYVYLTNLINVMKIYKWSNENKKKILGQVQVREMRLFTSFYFSVLYLINWKTQRSTVFILKLIVAYLIKKYPARNVHLMFSTFFTKV